jgi:hypothetical protein
MKTTVDIADKILIRIREVARREGTTLRSLVEEGLLTALARREQTRSSYHWPDLSFEGEGLADEVAEGGWESIRDRIYAGQGS